MKQNLFHNYLKDNFVKFKQWGFDLVKIDDTLYGFLRHTNVYKQFIKTFRSTDTKDFTIMNTDVINYEFFCGTISL